MVVKLKKIIHCRYKFYKVALGELLNLIKTLVKQIISIVAVRSGLFSLRRFDNSRRIVLLTYHRVSPEREVMGLSVSPLFFEKQLEFLKEHFKIISLQEAVSRLTTRTISGEYAVLTFDDGYRDNYDYAFPLLKKHNVPATIFVTVDGLETGEFGWDSFNQAILGSKRETIDLIEFGLGVIDVRTKSRKKQAVLRLHHELKKCAHQKREAVVRKVILKLLAGANCKRIMLTWNEVQEMHSSGLVTIGSHTISHPILSKVDRERAHHEITQSKAIIEEKLGSPIELFAYPNGNEEDFDDDHVAMLKNTGFSAACTTVPGSIMGGEDPFRLPRIDVSFSMCEGTGGRFSPEMFEVALVRVACSRPEPAGGLDP